MIIRVWKHFTHITYNIFRTLCGKSLFTPFSQSHVWENYKQTIQDLSKKYDNFLNKNNRKQKSNDIKKNRNSTFLENHGENYTGENPIDTDYKIEKHIQETYTEVNEKYEKAFKQMKENVYSEKQKLIL